MPVIRLSPSGAPIRNPEGGEADIGVGFALRMVEAAGSPSADTPIVTTPVEVPNFPTPLTLRVALSNPKPTLRYRIAARLEIENPGTTTTNLTMTVQGSSDGGTLWSHSFPAGEFQIVGPPAAGTTRQCSINIPPILGSAFGGLPLVLGAPSLTVRLVMSANNSGNLILPGGTTSGQNWLQLTEVL